MGAARAKQALHSAALPIGRLAAASPWLFAAAFFSSMPRAPRRSPRTPALPAAPPHRRRRAYDERTRFDVVWCMLVSGRVDVSQTQRAIACACTLLQGAHVPPSRATIFRICRRFRQTGLTTARPRCGPMISLTADQIDGLRRWCRKPGGKRRGTRLRRACVWFDMQFNRSVSTKTICRWLKRLGLTRKKGTRVALQQDPERVALFWETCQNLGLDPWETVWMDECGFDFRDFLLLYGYSEKGERFHTEEKLGRGERINSLASMWIGGCFDAEFFHGGNVTYDVFEGHCTRSLGPKMLRRGMKFLVLDNARIHHAMGNRIVQYFAALGIKVVFLAPYWPQGNPIGNPLNPACSLSV